jgi:hypothetical protein
MGKQAVWNNNNNNKLRCVVISVTECEIMTGNR